jgi:hypothetical protein
MQLVRFAARTAFAVRALVLVVFCFPVMASELEQVSLHPERSGSNGDAKHFRLKTRTHGASLIDARFSARTLVDLESLSVVLKQAETGTTQNCETQELGLLLRGLQELHTSLNAMAQTSVDFHLTLIAIPDGFRYGIPTRGSVHWPSSLTVELALPFDCSAASQERVVRVVSHEVAHAVRPGTFAARRDLLAEEAIAYTVSMCVVGASTGDYSNSRWTRPGAMPELDTRTFLDVGPRRFAAMFKGPRALRPTFGGVAITAANRDVVLWSAPTREQGRQRLRHYCNAVVARAPQIDLTKEIPSLEFAR